LCSRYYHYRLYKVMGSVTDAKAGFAWSLAAIETLEELDRRGYRLSVRTKVVVHDHKVGGARNYLC